MKNPLFLIGTLFILSQFASTANAQRHIFNRANKAWLVRYDDESVDSSRYGDKAIRIKMDEVPKPASGSTMITARLQRFTVDDSSGTNVYKKRDGNDGDVVLNGIIYSVDPDATNRERKRVKFVLTGSYPKMTESGLVTVSVRVWGLFDHGKVRPAGGGGGGGSHKDDDAMAIRLVVNEQPLLGGTAAPVPAALQTAMAPAFGPCPEEPDVDVLEEEDAPNLNTPPPYDSNP